jgi:uncharacterized membrane protein (DUF373 family)
MKKITFESNFIAILEFISKIIATLICISLLIASAIVVIDTFTHLLTIDFRAGAEGLLFKKNVDTAIQDGLFVLILLEMFYVVRSFIKYGSINVGIIVNVGIIAAVKVLVFKLDSINLEMALSFGIVFIALSCVYLAETIHFKQKQ